MSAARDAAGSFVEKQPHQAHRQETRGCEATLFRVATGPFGWHPHRSARQRERFAIDSRGATYAELNASARCRASGHGAERETEAVGHDRFDHAHQRHFKS